MLYSSLKFPDIFLDDSSIIVSLTLSDDGIEFTNKSLESIVTYLDEEYCTGLVIVGDSISNSNRKDVHDLVQTIRAIFGNDKKIHLNTNKSFDELILEKDYIIDEILRYVDSF